MTKDIFSIPGPEPVPFLGWRGNLLKLFGDPLVNLGKMREQYGDIYTLNRGGNPPLFFGGKGNRHTLMAFGAELNHQILSNSDVFLAGRVASPIVDSIDPNETDEQKLVLRKMTAGIFGMKEPEHRRHRRLLMPAFHKQHLQSYYDDMIQIITEEIDGWKLNQKIDLHREILRITLRVISHCLFGLDVRTSGREFSEVIQTWFHTAGNPLTISFQNNIPGLPYHHLLDSSQKLYNIFYQLILERQASTIEAHDVLSLMLSTKDEDGNPAFTTDQMIGNCTAFFVAGHETISNTLSWTFFLLSQHPQIMSRLHNELNLTIGSETPTYRQFEKMPYLEAVVKESLRILSPTPISGRIVASTVELGGYELPPGTEVGVSHFHTHQDPAIYKDPMKFDPSRWEHINPSAYEYIPFGAGIRTCIGMPFALMEMPLFIALILQRFRLELAPDANIEPYLGFNLYPKYGLPVIIRPLDGDYEAGSGHVKGKIRHLVDLP